MQKSKEPKYHMGTPLQGLREKVKNNENHRNRAKENNEES